MFFGIIGFFALPLYRADERRCPRHKGLQTAVHNFSTGFEQMMWKNPAANAHCFF